MRVTFCRGKFNSVSAHRRPAHHTTPLSSDLESDQEELPKTLLGKMFLHWTFLFPFLCLEEVFFLYRGEQVKKRNNRAETDQSQRIKDDYTD